ncbi:MAG: cyclic pyranopterin monophosphate synthase MoaC [Defluviitaleaceae bacterium]|nr:cyclic pyranopterin monophosphate synthase MoaC [Defluviitaleaceae bacterium]
MNEFTHFDNSGNAIMVDVGKKEITDRVAKAGGFIKVSSVVLDAVEKGTATKGDVLGVARIAAIMAVKRTSDLIPMCHPLAIDSCSVEFEIDKTNMRIYLICAVKLTGKTGVEMEALTGVSVGLLTIYDMCKALDKNMEIGGIRLIEKKGGKSSHA